MLAVIAALLLSARGVVRPQLTNVPATTSDYANTPVPGYAYGPGGMMGGSGMMGGGMVGGEHMSSGMMRGGMMGGYGYGQAAPTAEPTPVGATLIPLDEEIQIPALSLRFTPAEIIVQPGETVRFVVTNRDAFLHNFVSREAGIPLLSLPGNSTQTMSRTAPTTDGAYAAICTLHPGMSLSIAVED